MAKDLGHTDRNRVIKILGEQAAFDLDSPETFFRHLIMQEAHLPKRYVMEVSGSLDGNPLAVAGKIVRWASSKGTNRDDPRYTVLGSILTALLPHLGVDGASTIAAIISAYDLYNDKRLWDRPHYRLPLAATRAAEGMPDVGPDIDWWATDDEVELQKYLKPEPDYQDVGFLKRAIARATSVCKVEVPIARRQGTGFLVANDLVLTNYHVLDHPDVPDEDIVENARDAVLYFGNIVEEGGEIEGQDFKLDADSPILASSPADELDFALLQVVGSIWKAKGIEKAPCDYEQVPEKGAGLHLLGHPLDMAMQLSLSDSAVTGVREDKGLVQYWTRADVGSSGSPCFNDDWTVVALHHAGRAKAVGSRREGVLLKSILGAIEDQQIKDRLLAEK